MKFRALTAFTLLATLALSATAHAALVDTVDMGAVTTDGSSNFTLAPSGNSFSEFQANGYLPTNTEITFTYNANDVTGGTLISNGSYSYTLPGNLTATVAGQSSSDSATTTALPVLTLANITGSTASGTISIENLSSSVEKFTAFFTTPQLSSAASSVFAAQVSVVPLPSTIILFASALTALAGLAAYKKSRDRA